MLRRDRLSDPFSRVQTLAILFAVGLIGLVFWELRATPVPWSISGPCASATSPRAASSSFAPTPCIIAPANFGTLALSFLVAARLWMLHFKMHRVITRGDDVLLVLNMALLFGIVLMPFSAEVLSTYPLSPLSVSIYATNALVMLAMCVAIWCYARTRPHFLAEGTPPDYPARMMRYSLQIAAVFGGSIPVAWFAPRAALYMWTMIPLVEDVSRPFYGETPSTAKMRNGAYLSPIGCAFLRPGEPQYLSPCPCSRTETARCGSRGAHP
jgi:uncharacterized membrane protein